MQTHYHEKTISSQQWQQNCVRAIPSILSAVEAIENKDYIAARMLLNEIVAADMENPQPFNLLGVIYEKEGDRQCASKFYRVAYYMDQTYKAARLNLERVCESCNQGCHKIHWGVDITEVKK